MASAERKAPDPVALFQRLEEKPWRYTFYQAMRWIECAHPDKPRLGESRRPADDPVRFAQEPSMSFATSTLAYFGRSAGNVAPRLEVRCFGLLGPNGPLPLHITEFVRDRLRNSHDFTLARFLDVFHHRMLCLFYRAWANAQPAVNLDRPGHDRFSVYVGAAFGLGAPALMDRDDAADESKLFFAGRFALQTHNAEGLEAILRGYFGGELILQECVPAWLRLPEEGRCRLGESPETGTLGVSAAIGEQVWDCQHRFRILYGPLSLADYERMLPGGESLRAMTALVKNYIGDELAWDVNLVLAAEDVPASKLGEYGRLGWTTWLAPDNIHQDADDLFLEPAAHVH